MGFRITTFPLTTQNAIGPVSAFDEKRLYSIRDSVQNLGIKMDGLQQPNTNDASSRPQDLRPSIPLVDLDGLEANTTDEAALQAGKALVEAFQTAGFAYVKNHGIPDEAVESAFTWVSTSVISCSTCLDVHNDS